MRYRLLKTDFDVPEPIQEEFKKYVQYLNDNDDDGLSEDLYQMDLRSTLNMAMDMFTDEQFWELRDYYVSGGIHRDD